MYDWLGVREGIEGARPWGQWGQWGHSGQGKLKWTKVS